MPRGFVRTRRCSEEEPHLARGAAKLLDRLGVLGAVGVEAEFKDAGNGETEGNNGLSHALLQGELHVARVRVVRLQVEVVGAFCLEGQRAFSDRPFNDALINI